MSMDKLIADLMSGVSALTEATMRNNELLERVVAGQEAAMAKLEGGAAAPRKPRETAAEKKTREAAEAAAAATGTTENPPAVEQVRDAPPPENVHPLLAAANGEKAPKVNARTQKTEDVPTGNYRAADFSRDEVKNEFIGWLGEKPEVDEIKARQAFVQELGAHFGVKQVFADGALDEEQRKQALFYLRRKREGLKADFSADYNFDGDPLDDQSADGEDDGFDALG